MLQHTVARVDGMAQPIVICNQDQRFMVAEQLREMGCQADILLEPVARNTAPAIVVAAFRAIQQDDDAVLAVFPADHMIKNETAFRESLQIAVNEATANRLVVFGVKPLRAETGYGYILCSEGSAGAAQVESFVEKPNSELAQDYVASGQYYWNSGMFVFFARKLLSEVEKFHPGMVQWCRTALETGYQDLDFFRLDDSAFSQCENISIDCAVMEKTTDASMVALASDWSDVGCWQALWEAGDKDENQNVLHGDVVARDSSGCYASASTRLVSLVGVNDLVVVETADSILVVEKGKSQDVSAVVAELEAGGRSEYLHHREVFQPWGSYSVVDAGNRYYVKRVKVNPGASLSLQIHYHRAEHWVVVSGTAQIQRGDDAMVLTENQSTYIPLGEKHRLSNPGEVPLYLVEVASGTYLAEDDVVRFEDQP